MPVKATRPSAYAATAGAKPISIRYFVWCTCTAYHAKSPPTNATTTHQKREVRIARANVQSTDAQASSTTFEGAPAAGGAGGGRAVTVGQEPHLLRAPAREQIQRRQRHDDQRGHRHTRRAPPRAGDEPLEPRQDDDRADADTGERAADREPPAAHEPVRQEERVARVAQAHGAAGDEHAERQIEMPGRRHEGC